MRFGSQVVLVCLLLASAACRQETKYFGRVSPPGQNVFRYNNGAEPEFLDPGLMVADTDWRIAALLFEGLTTKDPKTLLPRPGVAERWEISDNGLTYTFHLRHDARWSNGRAVTAQDFVYSWTRLLDPRLAARYADQFYMIVNAEDFNRGKLHDPSQLGIQAIGDFTLRVRLREPVPYFLFLTGNAPLLPVPRWVVERYGDRWTEPDKIVGNGPFQLVEHRTHDRIVVKRNPLYWDAQAVRLDRVIAYAIDDNHTSANLYESGRLDYIPAGYFPAEYVPYMRGRYRDFRSDSHLAIYYYSLNVTHPPLDNVLVRRALAMAIDRRAITDELLRGGQIPGAHFVPVGLPGYQSPRGPEFNPQEAARLLARAGYPNGKGFPDLELRFNTLESHRRIAEAVQQMWAKYLHIHIRLHNEEWAAFLKTRKNLEYDIARDGWIGDYPDPSAFIDLMESTNGNNDTGWKNAEYDRLLALSRRETDPKKRLHILRQCEEILLREVPVIPLYTYASNSLIKPYVRGIYPTSQDVHPLNEVCIDRHWRERGNSRDGSCE